MIVNKRELAEILEMSERTLSEWQQQGMPVELIPGRGLDNQYSTAKVIEWMVQKALAGEKKESGTERLQRLQAEQIEYSLAQKSGELVAAADVERLWTAGILAVRTELMALGDRLKRKLDNEYRINVDPTLIENEVLAALAKVADQSGDIADGVGV